MARKIYTKDAIMGLLKRFFKASEVYQLSCDYDNEYRIQADDEQDIPGIKRVEVVDLETAIRNEEDIEIGEGKNKFLWRVITSFIKNHELPAVGSYTRLAENLYWSEV